MFFVASKVLGFFASFSNCLVVMGLVGALLTLTRFRRAALVLLVASPVLLAVFGLSPLANVLLLSLSERFPPWQQGVGREPDGIIVLGGAIDSEASDARGTIEMDSSAERILGMLDLARRYPRAKIVFTGGSGNLMMDSMSEAPFVKLILERNAVAEDRIVLEGRSRTTAENARFTRDLVTPKPGERWLLVTSAFHMPRSISAFRQAGFGVEAYPVDFRTRGWRDALLPFDRLSAGLARADLAIHEWAGLLAYRLTGRSDDLLPAPRP